MTLTANRTKIPVLMYHEVVNISRTNKQMRIFQSPYYISTNQFVDQMNYLYSRNFKSISLTDLIKIKENKNKYHSLSEDKLVVITFDDGYIGNYENAFPILRKFQFRATFFMIVKRIGTPNYMSWDQLNLLQEKGMDIQSHTLTHRPLEILSVEETGEELRNSKRILEENLSTPVYFLSYPHGYYDNRVIKVAEESGYVGACNSEWGYFDFSSNPYEIKRVAVRREYQMTDFVKILNQDKKFILKSRTVARIKRLIRNIVGTKNYMKIYDKMTGST